MEEYIKNEIMDQNRHLFVYGYDNKNRTEEIKSIEKLYPIKTNIDSPMAIYVEQPFVSNININFENINSLVLSTLCREHLSYAIAYSITDRVLKTVDEEELNGQDKKRILMMSNVSIKDKSQKITSLKELRDKYLLARNIYFEAYQHHVNGTSEEINKDDVQMPYVQVEYFVQYMKGMLNNPSYFGILIDGFQEMSLTGQQAINNYVAARINKDISMKIITDINNWETFYNQTEKKVDAVHDYGIIDLDGNAKDYIEKQKKKTYAMI